eukprot:CAMPEP_0202444638 /NCGR_PEP_ID=MMETSP1360-20130828/3633_1 /ASSEMBLY_ACC=CAM_ASM_000848 /TAXON_ID=515479 /ORGANISM="Licmophora paradoxa, Strain CCMP2313" /LENGTH=223 /DNA_ID=CAMNT_0049060667 /DNA_START=368 /DNA_END=1039 /DNA_ORIENTATION=-
MTFSTPENSNLAHAVTTPSSTSARLIPLARTSDSNFVDNPKDLYALERLGDQEEALRILLPVFSPETKDENDENRSSHGGQDMGLAIQEPPHFGFENVTRMGGMSSSSSRMRDGIGPRRPRLRLKPRINTNRHQDDTKIDVMGQEIHYISEFSMNTSRASSFPPRTQHPMGLVSGQPPRDSSLRPVHWMEMMGQNHQRGNNMDAPRLQRPIPRRPLYGNQNRY